MATVASAVLGIYLSNSDRLFGRGQESGALTGRVNANTTNIVRIDKNGSVATQEIEKKVIAVEGRVGRNEKDLLEIKRTIQRQLESISTKIDGLKE